ncbi:MAG: cryptochrome/photolyase family protein [Candidatus Nanopelagicales bacterium]
MPSRTQTRRALVWFRRDLRDFDHAALHHALHECEVVYCGFVFDTEILDALPTQADRRVDFIWRSLRELASALERRGGGLLVRSGAAREVVPALANELGVDAVYANEDYEPAARDRDAVVAEALGSVGRELRLSKDQVVFARGELLTAAGQPFTVYTPYRNAWRRALTDSALAPLPAEPAPRLAPVPPRLASQQVGSLSDIGLAPTDLALAAGMSGGQGLLAQFRPRLPGYREGRNFPGQRGVSYLSPHLRFGTVSVRELYRVALAEGSDGAQCWVDELIWREFYQQVLWHRPDVVTANFRPAFDAVDWESGPGADADFAAWCAGRTGYPIVDAGMRQLVQTGYMHNRLRMVTASFLTKDLGIHWLRGERFFAQYLLDYDLAANNGGWQWAASTGCDAQPWFRIFNPVLQSRKFDAAGVFIRRYCPELSGVPDRFIHAPWEMDASTQRASGCFIGTDYPGPLVDHAAARQATLARFQAAR